MIYIVKYLNAICPSKRFNFEFNTNGTLLTNNVAKLLFNYEIKATFSIDGPPEIHNYYRRYPTGEGSYNNCINGINNYKNYNQILRTQTTIHNCSNMIEIYKFLVHNLNSKHMVINPVRKSYFRDISPDLFESNKKVIEFANKMEEIAEVILNSHEYMPFPYLFNKIISSLHRRSKTNGVCALISMPIVSADGNLYPCPMFMN